MNTLWETNGRGSEECKDAENKKDMLLWTIDLKWLRLQSLWKHPSGLLFHKIGDIAKKITYNFVKSFGTQVQLRPQGKFIYNFRR